MNTRCMPQDVLRSQKLLVVDWRAHPPACTHHQAWREAVPHDMFNIITVEISPLRWTTGRYNLSLALWVFPAPVFTMHCKRICLS